MPSNKQKTIKDNVELEGIGLHNGIKVKLSLKPAPANSGIKFKRIDVDNGKNIIEANYNNVNSPVLCTKIQNSEGVSISTIEHLMAAFYGEGIDNVLVEINAPEVPIMDGSSEPFVSLIECAGVVEQSAPRRVIRILKPVNVEVGDSQATLMPADRPSLDVEIDFDSAFISNQALSIGLVNGSFCKELARARTFGFLHEVEQMRAAGLAKGGSLENAVVVSQDGVLNDGGLRFDDEFVRHKMLDAVGDLYLAGGHIIGQFSGIRSGHAINNALLRALFADSEAWTVDVMRSTEAATAVDGGLTAEPVSAST